MNNVIHSNVATNIEQRKYNQKMNFSNNNQRINKPTTIRKFEKNK